LQEECDGGWYEPQSFKPMDNDIGIWLVAVDSWFGWQAANHWFGWQHRH